MNTRFQHVKFYKIKIAEDFHHGKLRYCKSGFFTGHAILDGALVIVMPWVKVRSIRLFGRVPRVAVPLPSAEPKLRVVPAPAAITEPVE